MVSKPPGVEDIFPDRSVKWNFILENARKIFGIYNFREIIVPVMEFTEVFTRSIGDDTDIVSKEMFTFEDRGGRSLTLRPEGTAGVVRAYVENGEYNRLALCKFFYMGQMFRAEKPQRGRLRQFNQLGAEIFGSDNPFYDFEIIATADSITRNIGVTNYSLLLNSIGCRKCRPAYTDKLKEYYSRNSDKLCEDCKKRLNRNPLRLLDCKNDTCLMLKKDAPVISDHVCSECDTHFNKVRSYLDIAGILYTIDNHLVRGLDYYTRTTFEFTAGSLGSQNAFAGGGRYDYLVEQFGGKPTPGVGFAAGIERLFLLIESTKNEDPGIDAFLIHTGGEAYTRALDLLLELRKNGIKADIDPDVKGFKTQFKKAEREKASHVLIIGEDEFASGKVNVKNQVTGEQQLVSSGDIIEFLNKQLRS